MTVSMVVSTMCPGMTGDHTEERERNSTSNVRSTVFVHTVRSLNVVANLTSVYVESFSYCYDISPSLLHI